MKNNKENKPPTFQVHSIEAVLSMSDIRNPNSFDQIRDLIEGGCPIIIKITYAMLNRNILKATQRRADPTKLKNLLRNDNHQETRYPSVILRRRVNSKGKKVIEVLVGDGSHRIALCLKIKGVIYAQVQELWDEAAGEEFPGVSASLAILGFNSMLNELQSMIGPD
jgi:hypothetical protein